MISGWIPSLVMVIYVIFSVIGLALFKGADGFFTLRGLFGLSLYMGGFLIWIFVILRIMPLSTAFPIAAGALIAASQLAGWMILHEKLSNLHLLGVLLVLAGVTAISVAARQHS